MVWQYEQSTGNLSQDGNLIATGYSGHGVGLNNADDEFLKNIGPIPQGVYTIGSPKEPIDILGPIAMPLEPDPNNNMEGRDAFYIHGDNSEGNQSASNGCIILSHDIRTMINESDDKTLIVVA
jgi:lipoprotein-anchoring transpeptidase ErfK/SrfK